MRNNLLTEKENTKYTGTFIRYGSLYEYGIKFITVLIRNIKTEKEIVTDHQWFRINQGFEGLSLEEGDIVTFTAEVSTYLKGYFGKKKEIKKIRKTKLDYQLSNLENIEVKKSMKGIQLCEEAQ